MKATTPVAHVRIGDSMSDLKALAQRLYDEVMTAGNLDSFDELVAEDFVEHEVLPGMPSGRESPGK